MRTQIGGGANLKKKKYIFSIHFYINIIQLLVQFGWMSYFFFTILSFNNSAWMIKMSILYVLFFFSLWKNYFSQYFWTSLYCTYITKRPLYKTLLCVTVNIFTIYHRELHEIIYISPSSLRSRVVRETFIPYL